LIGLGGLVFGGLVFLGIGILTALLSLIVVLAVDTRIGSIIVHIPLALFQFAVMAVGGTAFAIGTWTINLIALTVALLIILLGLGVLAMLGPICVTIPLWIISIIAAIIAWVALAIWQTVFMIFGLVVTLGISALVSIVVNALLLLISWIPGVGIIQLLFHILVLSFFVIAAILIYDVVSVIAGVLASLFILVVGTIAAIVANVGLIILQIIILPILPLILSIVLFIIASVFAIPDAIAALLWSIVKWTNTFGAIGALSVAIFSAGVALIADIIETIAPIIGGILIVIEGVLGPVVAITLAAIFGFIGWLIERFFPEIPPSFYLP